MSPSNQHWLLFGTLHEEVGRLVEHIKTARVEPESRTDAGNLGHRKSTRSCDRIWFSPFSSRDYLDGELTTKDSASGFLTSKQDLSGKRTGMAMKQDEFRKWLVAQGQTDATASSRIWTTTPFAVGTRPIVKRAGTR
jgi:hypothetical protein